MKQKDKTYQCFIEALRACNKQNWKGHNKALAGKCGISVPYLSQLLNEKRMASFKAQIKIAKELGYEYIDFLKIGLKIIEGKTVDLEPTEDLTITEIKDYKKHRDVIKTFKDKHKALEFNQALSRLEKLAPKKYNQLYYQAQLYITDIEIQESEPKIKHPEQNKKTAQST